MSAPSGVRPLPSRLIRVLLGLYPPVTRVLGPPTRVHGPAVTLGAEVIEILPDRLLNRATFHLSRLSPVRFVERTTLPTYLPTTHHAKQNEWKLSKSQIPCLGTWKVITIGSALHRLCNAHNFPIGV